MDKIWARYRFRRRQGQASSSAIINLVGGALRAATYSVNNLNQYSAISNAGTQVALQYDLNGNVANKTSATATNIFICKVLFRGLTPIRTRFRRSPEQGRHGLVSFLIGLGGKRLVTGFGI